MYTRDEIVEVIRAGMARSLWMSAYADYAEENRDDPDIARAKGGEDWNDVVPFLEPVDGTDDPSQLAADDLIKLYVAENVVSSISDLYDRAVAAMEAAGMDVDDEDAVCSDFGFALAQMAVGSGLSWFDDHPKFPLKKPFFECHFDGDELTWSGGSSATQVNPTKKRTVAEVRKILAGISERCSTDCRGWVISHDDDLAVQRCDECIGSLPRDQRLSDAELAQLPEAKQELASVRKATGNPDGWIKSKSHKNTWDKKFGSVWYTVEKHPRLGWLFGIRDSLDDEMEMLGGRRNKDEAIKAAERDAATSNPKEPGNPDGWTHVKVRKDWPETWEKKLGPWWYTVEKAPREGWYMGWGHKQGNPDDVDRGARFPSREAAMKFAEEHARVVT